MSLRYPGKQRSCEKSSGSVLQILENISSLETGLQGEEAQVQAHGSKPGSEEGRLAPIIHTRCLRPVRPAYYLSPPRLLEESCFELDPQHAQERAKEPFGGEVKLMPQSRFRSLQRLHSLRSMGVSIPFSRQKPESLDRFDV